MRLTKDEARILASAMDNFKYEAQTRHIDGSFEKLMALQQKLEIFGKDNRRIGRTSQNTWTDLLKRFTNKS